MRGHVLRPADRVSPHTGDDRLSVRRPAAAGLHDRVRRTTGSSARWAIRSSSTPPGRQKTPSGRRRRAFAAQLEAQIRANHATLVSVLPVRWSTADARAAPLTHTTFGGRSTGRRRCSLSGCGSRVQRVAGVAGTSTAICRRASGLPSGHADAVGQHFAFDSDQAADPSDDARARVQRLIRPRSTGN